MKNTKWFTLVEIMLWILIVSIVIVWWFQAFASVMIWKSRLIQEAELQKESFYFTQRFFEMIKMWWTIDFEEYFNRRVIWDTTYSSWHFSVASWFGNFGSWWSIWNTTYWSWFYYCRSWDNDTLNMWTLWCYNNNFNTYWSSLSNKQQRYWQYSFQFIDYNSNMNNDSWILWDEDWDWNPIWDDDDEYLWEWPEVFTWWLNLTELYLISWNKKTRTYFRWFVYTDPDAPSWNTCTLNWANEITWSWCIWTVQYLILQWEDKWMNHNNGGTTYNDWVIDTWLIDDNFIWWWSVAWTWTVNRINLFPDTINVSEFIVYTYPNKDITRAWKNTDDKININPYVQIKTKLKPSWKSRKKIRWEWKELDFSMTVNLSWMYSQ